ncbi:Ca(2+)-dependent cysteine protease [Perkinsus chesapeaki]|uniref:Ca(2+)-dependent cysteine protease n=1 Tax=Perkinsus chesapeaki TaxID=330153 RepID=A0A7J6N0X8_PERCH|nr:Ca(2+)-dependent cysteine protease [Perkinsus chesapeaki]
MSVPYGRPFTDDDIKAVSELCPASSSSDVELALWRSNGNRNMAANMLLNQQGSASNSGSGCCFGGQSSAERVPQPAMVSAQPVPHQQVDRSAEIRCCSCQQVMDVKVRGYLDQTVEAEAQCPNCHQMNRFVLPAEKPAKVTPIPAEATPYKPYTQSMPEQASAPQMVQQNPPMVQQQQQQLPNGGVTPSMEAQAQMGLPQSMKMQPVQVGTVVPTLTGANIIRYMHWLVKDAKPGDIFFFHYSGHGAQQEDPLHLEEDGMNETIIPVDVQKSGQITDDVIHQTLVDPLPSGARLTSVMDCCHSGTGMDLPWAWLTGRGWKEDVNPWLSKGDVQLFSGCDDSQTSADASTGNQRGGAMTTAFCNAIRRNPQVTYTALIENLDIEMKREHMSQRPQLSSSQVFPIDRPFNLTDILPNQNQYVGRIVHKKFAPHPNANKNRALNALLAGTAGFAGGMLLGDAIGQNHRRPPVVVGPGRRPVVVEPRRRPVVVGPRRPGPVFVAGPRGPFGGKGKGFRW